MVTKPLPSHAGKRSGVALSSYAGQARRRHAFSVTMARHARLHSGELPSSLKLRRTSRRGRQVGFAGF